MSANAQHPTIGREYGNYIVRSLLGEGGMGAVFLAEHKFLGDRVAIKILHGTYAHNKSLTDRFFQEAKSARDIGHPSIIKIIDFGQSDDGGLYLVMEVLEGESLTAFLRRGRPPEKVAAKIGAELADGLAAAHAKGIVHRDLKPDNIFVVPGSPGGEGGSDGGGVKILDFGIAKVLNSSGKTGTGALLGTPRYMAPEQAKGAKGVGPHSDVYALGVILFEMLTGRATFEASELTELLVKILMEAPPRASELSPISAEMDAIIAQCLAKDPAARPSGMVELRDRLATIAGGTVIHMPVVARASGSFAVATANSTTVSGSVGQMDATRISLPGDAPRGRNKLGLAIAIAAGVGIGGAGAILGMRHSSEPPSSIVPVAVTAKAAALTQVDRPAPARADAAHGEDESGRPSVAAAPIAPVSSSTVVVRSEPPGAQVLVDDKAVGVTPAVISVMLPHQIVLTLEGYQTAREVLTTAGETKVALLPVAKEIKRPASRPLLDSKAQSPKARKPAAPADVSLD